MKIKIILAIMITLAGCQKPQDDQGVKVDGIVSKQFEKSDAIISSYLDKLDNTNTSREEKTQILCKDYPAEYKKNYMPALLKSENNHYTEAKLLNDLKSALDFYKAKENIQCE
ncbi:MULTISPECIES: hypothetical protein [unclassified Acinetobacter]|uniref:hypothetical protein n=1 Tax=unclassified Acinetobacter TaxID=196816 RepID=UPI00190C99C6|nr:MULTISPECIES: hypothetical protein [unclassified Acinetobacter]MBK0062179.1 hypothetical protein [Acinetobacter sp. S55]MBK0065983.1 hypothetical protein [Acinetobacter sp. S54]